MDFQNIIVEGVSLNVVKTVKSSTDDNFYFGLVIKVLVVCFLHF